MNSFSFDEHYKVLLSVKSEIEKFKVPIDILIEYQLNYDGYEYTPIYDNRIFGIAITITKFEPVKVVSIIKYYILPDSQVAIEYLGETPLCGGGNSTYIDIGEEGSQEGKPLQATAKVVRVINALTPVLAPTEHKSISVDLHSILQSKCKFEMQHKELLQKEGFVAILKDVAAKVSQDGVLFLHWYSISPSGLLYIDEKCLKYDIRNSNLVLDKSNCQFIRDEFHKTRINGIINNILKKALKN